MDILQQGVVPPPAYRVEVIPRMYSVAIYDDNHPVNYFATCQVFVYGDLGLMFAIIGPRFYDALANRERLTALMGRLGVRTLEGYVVPGHARLMKFMLRRIATVDILHTGEMAGHAMSWVRVRLEASE